MMKEGEPADFFCILARGQVKVTKNGRLLNLLGAGEPFGEMAYLSHKDRAPRGADITVASNADIISVPTQNLARASEGCRAKFDRAFMQIVLARLSMANGRLPTLCGHDTTDGFDIEVLPLADLLRGPRPAPSLLHGDLWRGNAGFVAGGPVVFDPAVYYGDREADLAMTELFGGFPPAFYASYNENYPLESGYRQRKHLYNLYHLLNHLNLFGGGYLGQVTQTLRLLLGFLD